MRNAYWHFALSGVVLLAFALRLHGIHDPLLDHPGWRQGDTAAIARNFARLQYNILYPQTMYDGPPPNYVELELQIVPFLAATLYKVFGIHEVFGRLITIAFSLGTVVVAAYFARWLFGSAVAGIAAAFCYAVFPGSVYYGRTFMPDAAMVFFLTASLYAAARYLESRTLSTRGLLGTTALLALAYLAKPVAVLAVVPLGAMIAERVRARRSAPPLLMATLLAVPLLLLLWYDRRIAAYAEWHWASGIARLHVLPALQSALTSAAAFTAKLAQLRLVLGMLRDTLLGRISFLLLLLGFAALPWIRTRTRTLLWAWLAGVLLFAYAVVTVERVDYYLYPAIPLAAIVIGGATSKFIGAVRDADAAAPARYALLALVPLLAGSALLSSHAAVASYYEYNK
ncbi:MAG: glycosyltransferase family 39 protein, partial [Candidatus Eremiobacteraeota bacterium]|nr:glycosyltransferase family 39 protein [Candidatus Eremiobacteraeota bacterium]